VFIIAFAALIHSCPNACALSLLASPLPSSSLPSPIFSHLPPSRLPSSPASIPCLRSPAVSASFPVSVLPLSQPPSLSPFSPVSAYFPVSVLPRLCLLPCLRSPAVLASFPVSDLPRLRLLPYLRSPAVSRLLLRVHLAPPPPPPLLPLPSRPSASISSQSAKLLSRSSSGAPRCRAVAIQLRRSLLSSCRDPAPALPAPDRRNRNGV
ncbi:hypothetical protein ACLOJK_005338, partial [Asimina triloba]